ncbi:hypothetical protein D3C81_1977840 [compost metagenome]
MLCGQLQFGGNLHGQWTEQVPDHEAQVEIQEGCKQGRGMAGFPEARIHRTPQLRLGSQRGQKKRRHSGRLALEGRATSLSDIVGNRRWLPAVIV